MKHTPLVCASSLCALLLLCTIPSAVVASDDYRIRGRTIPNGFEREAAFFDLTKMPNEPAGAFDAGNAPAWNLAELGKYLPSDGIEFLDVNHVCEGRIDRDRITQELKDRKGAVFRAFAHLSHIYSVPYKQYSELTFSLPSADTSVVNVADWYILTFKRTGSHVVVIRWEYRQLESE